MKKYVKLHIWEFVFTTLVSFGFAVNISSSFVIETPYLNNYPLLIGIAILVNAFLFSAAYNKKTTIVGIAVYILLAIVGAVYIINFVHISNLEGATAGPQLLFLILILTTTLTFLCSRVQILFLVFSAVALVFSAAFRFLEYPVSIPCLFIMILGLLLEAFYKVYYDSLLVASYGNFNLRHFVTQNVVIGLLILGISTGTFYGVVKQINPPTRDLKLVTELLSWDVVDKIGISSKTEVASPDKKTDKTNDTLEREDKPEDEPKDQEEKNDDIQKENHSNVMAFAIKYDYSTNVLYVIIAVIILLLLTPFVIKFALRKRQLKKINELSPTEGSLYLYSYFLSKFKYANVEKPQNATLLEYVVNAEKELKEFNTEKGTTFEDLTRVYNKQIYGGYEPTSSEYELFKDFYNEFFKNMRKIIGTPKYAFRFWRV